MTHEKIVEAANLIHALQDLRRFLAKEKGNFALSIIGGDVSVILPASLRVPVLIDIETIIMKQLAALGVTDVCVKPYLDVPL